MKKDYWKYEAKVLRIVNELNKIGSELMRENKDHFRNELQMRLGNELLKKAGDFGARMAKGEHEYMMTGKLPETGNEELARLKEENEKLKQNIRDMAKFSSEQNTEMNELRQKNTELERLNSAGMLHVERQANEIVMLQKKTEQNANGILAAMKEANSVIQQLESQAENNANEIRRFASCAECDRKEIALLKENITKMSWDNIQLEKENEVKYINILEQNKKISKLENRELELLAEVKDLKEGIEALKKIHSEIRTDSIPTLDAYNEKFDGPKPATLPEYIDEKENDLPF